MEISLIEEEAKIEEIRGYKALRYEVKNNGKDINKVLVYTQWLNIVKAEKGENGIVTYCTNCHLFFYFSNLSQKHLDTHSNCTYSNYSEFCEYCGELFNENSICCFRKSFEMLKFYYYTEFFSSFEYWNIFFPTILLFCNISFIFKIIYSKRSRKRDDINYIDMEIFVINNNLAFFIFINLIFFVNTLAFLVPYICTIYFFQLFRIIKLHKQRERDIENDIFRY